ncbi:MAG: translocation/assembly module TamB domain-containing protein [Tannerellaceae bacterium]|nr:translocation/assembly module TamB domain-containing protein [Tannerellaceae bacterium]
MRKVLKWVGIICLIPVLLVLLLAILLYIPPVQKFVINKAIGYANSATGMEIAAERIRIGFPLKLDVSGVQVILPPADTLLTARSLSAHIKPLPLLKKQVEFSGFDLESVTLNTDTLIDGVWIKGSFAKLDLDIDVVKLKEEQVLVHGVNLSDANVQVVVSEAKNEKDSTSNPANWIIKLDRIDLTRVTFGMQIPASDLRMTAFVDQANLNNGNVDLFTSEYTADEFTLSNSSFMYDANTLSPTAGLDPQHIGLSDLNVRISSLAYKETDIDANIEELRVKERSGLAITSLNGKIHSDSTTIEIPDLQLQTTASRLRLMASLPWSAFKEEPQGSMRAMLRGTIGRSDLIKVAGQLPENIQEAYPDQPLTLIAGAEGNINVIRINQLKADLPEAFTLNASGTLRRITEADRRSGNITFSARTRDMRFVNNLLPPDTRGRVRIPSGIELSGDVSLAGTDYRGRVLMTESQGRVQVNGRYDTTSEAYGADIRITNLQPDHFLPQDSLMWLTATIRGEGRGTDLYSASTRASLQGQIQDVRYASTELKDVAIQATLQQNQAHVEVQSDDPNADLDIQLDAVLRRNYIQGTLSLEANHIDFNQLHLLTDTVATTFSLYAEGESDLKKDNTLDLTIGNWEIATPQRTYHPKLVTLHANTDADTTRVSLHTGDLGVVLTGNADLETMTAQVTTLSGEISHQLARDTMITITTLRPLLPDASLDVDIGTDNILYSYLMQQGIRFNRVFLDATTSPEEGINADGGVFSLIRDTLRIDTVLLAIRQDTAGLVLNVEVEKNRYRNQAPFTASVEGHLRDAYADALVTYRNEKEETGILLGVRANKVPDGINLTVFPDQPVLAFRPFTVNQNNYITYYNSSDIRANLRLTGEDNASIWVHSEPMNAKMQEIQAELNQFDLKTITEGFPQLPSMSGILNAEVSYAPSDSSFQIVANVHVDTLFYEGGRVGELMANVVYLPLGPGKQQVDVHLFRDGQEALSATALYTTGTPDNIDGSISVDHLPMAMVSPFIPDNMATLSGALNGDMTITGSTERPTINGYLQMDTAAIYVTPANSTFRLDSSRISVENSLISFNEYKIYSESNDPFTMDGTVDLGNISNIVTDLRMNASNMELLNASRTSESLIYGKLLIDLNTTIKGPVSDLSIRGDVHLLGSTNVTYVMTESPLTVQDRMDGLVTFVNFADTFSIDRNRRPEVRRLGGMDILFVARIDESVQLNVDLTPDQSNRVELIGGGDLTFQSNSEGIIVLNGTYTLSGGTVSYTLPVVPLKDFSVHEGSYVTWTGDPVNPTVNLTATERIRASVASDNGNRLVNFDVGIVVTGNLEDLNLNFTLSSPDDGEVQTELAAMGDDELARQAVGMLITGRYLAGGSDGMNFDMGSALNSFLQNEIGNIAGSALKSVDISFDMDTYNDDGQSRTDYSFKFAKRFYNDRIQVVIGGRVTTGEDISANNQSFIDDVSIEYRLDQSGTRYVKVFHDTNYESILEGEITETGVGLVLRKKIRYLRDLFIFRKNKNKPVAENEK